MNRKILFVDDDENILAAYSRNFRNKYEVTTNSSPVKALEQVKSGNSYALIVSDYRMPEMNGVQFLNEIKQIVPDTVRIMLTGYADINTAIESVNEGNIFRFLTKPCPPEKLIPNLDSGLEQFRLITSERELLDNTLKGSIKLLIELISSGQSAISEKAMRLRRTVGKLASNLPYEIRWQAEIAALLSQIGCITLPDDVLQKLNNNQALTLVEKDLFNTHPQIGASLLRNIPRLDIIADAIALQYLGANLGDDGGNERQAEVNQVAKLLHNAIAIDEAKQKELLSKRQGGYLFDGSRNNLFRDTNINESSHTQIRSRVSELKEGMILAQDLKIDGVLILRSGQELSNFQIQKIKNLAGLGKVKDGVIVFPRK